jgi:hypothetical protein
VDNIVLSGAQPSCYQAHTPIVLSGAKYRAIRRTNLQKIKEIQRVSEPLNDLTIWILY